MRPASWAKLGWRKVGRGSVARVITGRGDVGRGQRGFAFFARLDFFRFESFWAAHFFGGESRLL